jgi:hypothetical protein
LLPIILDPVKNWIDESKNKNVCEIKNDFINKSMAFLFLEKIKANMIEKKINLKYGILFLNDIK